MDAFDTLNLTSAQLEVHDISTPPNDLPTDRQAEPLNGNPGQNCQICIIA